MSAPIPSATVEFFTHEYFEQLLRTDRSDSTISVRNVHFRPACQKGDNFTSDMLRVTVTFTSDAAATTTTEQNISLIVKCELKTSAVVEDLLRGLGLFRKEIECFTRILPAVQRLLRSIGDDMQLAARCLDASHERSYIVFEDLAVKGYTNVRKQTGLSVPHMRLLVKKLAKWHAATVVLEQQDPSVTDMFRAEQFDPANKSWHQILKNSAVAVADATALMPGFEEIAAKIARALPTLSESYFQATVRRPDALNCISHGDLWSSNIMFTHDRNVSGQQPTDVLLVDFQIGSFTSHVSDLIHVLYTSSAKDVRAEDWSQLVGRYHEVLVQTLQKFGYTAKPLPTQADVWAEWKRRGVVAAFMLPYFAATRMLELDGGADMGRMSGDGPGDREYRRDLVLTPESRRYVEFLFRYSDESGFYDF